MKFRFLLISMAIFLMIGCGNEGETQNSQNGNAGVNSNVVKAYPNSTLIGKEETDSYIEYQYETSHEFPDILSFYDEVYGDPTNENYETHNEILLTYDSLDSKFSIKMTYKDNNVSEIKILEYK